MDLCLEDEEEEAFQKDVRAIERERELSLVGTYLTESVVNFPSQRNIMADLLHPIGGTVISDIGEKRYLFKFFNMVDLNRVFDGYPWFFNNHFLLLHKLQMKEDPLTIPLNFTAFFIEIHDLSSGLMSESLAKWFGAFFSEFLEYNTIISTMVIQHYMRVKVRNDVRLALKRKKKIHVGDQFFYACFQYEKLSLFFFI